MEIKVGDRIQQADWRKKGEYLLVTAVGKRTLLGFYNGDSDYIERDYPIDKSWLPYKEPKKFKHHTYINDQLECADCGLPVNIVGSVQKESCEPKKKILLAPAIIKSSDGNYLISISLYASKKDAETQQYNSFYSFICWPAIPNKDGFYEVEGELVE